VRHFPALVRRSEAFFSSSKPLLLEWVPSGCEHDVIFCSTGPGSKLSFALTLSAVCSPSEVLLLHVHVHVHVHVQATDWPAVFCRPPHPPDTWAPSSKNEAGVQQAPAASLSNLSAAVHACRLGFSRSLSARSGPSHPPCPQLVEEGLPSGPRPWGAGGLRPPKGQRHQASKQSSRNRLQEISTLNACENTSSRVERQQRQRAKSRCVIKWTRPL
jgi:hypothetical protein